jgi:hypothetical protein
MSSRFAPFGLPQDEINYRRAAFLFFRPDLYDLCVKKGQRLYNTLNDIIPPIKVPSTVQLTSWYDISRGTKRLPADKELEDKLREWNVGSDNFEFIEVSSFGPETEPAYINWFNVREKCLLNWDNWKDKDLNADDAKLFPSEIIWQSYILAGDKIPHFDPSSLRLIVRKSVVNLSARRATWYAARRSTSTIEDSSSGYAEYTGLLCHTGE